MSPLVLLEILGVFVKTLTGDPKYSVQDCENLQLPIQMQLSEKQKAFSLFSSFFFFFFSFLESTSNFKSFENKDNHDS